MKKIVTAIWVSIILGTPTSYAWGASQVKIYLNDHWEVAPPPKEEAALMASLMPGASVSVKTQAESFLKENRALFRDDPDIGWQASREQAGSALHTVRVEKTWRGLPVLGGEALVHYQDGSIRFASADSTPLNLLPSRPRLSGDEVKGVVFASLRGLAKDVSEPKLMVLVTGEPKTRTARLVYEFSAQDPDGVTVTNHYVDTETGREILSTSNVHTVLDRTVLIGLGTNDDWDVLESGGAFVGWRLALADRGCGAQTGSYGPCSPTDSVMQTGADAAWSNAKMVYDYYRDVHQRDSIDGAGMEIKEVVHFGPGWNNAAWVSDRAVMIYGSGNGTLYDFASPLDVTGHELTHGITSHTADLLYAAESGALNESYSDVFGKLIAFHYGKTNDWKIGAELFRDGKSFIRDMEHPTIAHVRDFKYRGEPCTTGQFGNDSCGVHENSGIPSLAAVLIAKSLGPDKMAKLYYLTLTQLLRSGSTFKEAGAQTEEACGILFGKESSDCTEVKRAFTTVGIDND